MLSRAMVSVNQRALVRVNALSQKITCRSMHVACRIRSVDFKNRSVFRISKYSPVFAAGTNRYLSTTEAATNIVNEQVFPNAIGTSTDSRNAATSFGSEPSTTVIESTPIDLTPNAASIINDAAVENVTAKLLENIPDAPIAPITAESIVRLTDPPFSELGLGGWSPIGIVQQCMEFMHVSWGLPWWEVIAVGTMAIRFLVLPLVIKSQKNIITMNNNMPELVKLQHELQEAKMEGDQILISRKARELQDFARTTKYNPLKVFLIPMAQAPIFISVFFGLRRMAELPVVSLEEGGILWFTDLTVPDPYYVLPLMTCMTLFAVLEIGADSASTRTMGKMKYVLRALPIVLFPVALQFPAAILCYWVATNIISIIQVVILRIPRVRTFFGIPAMIKTVRPKIPGEDNFIKSFKNSYNNFKTAREVGSREIADDAMFYKAGRGPVQETFLTDPTKKLMKPKKPASILAKKK